MKILVLAEHDQQELKDSTLTTLGAAQKLGGEIHLLICGHHIQDATATAKKISCVKKLLLADHPTYEYMLAEDVANLVVGLAKDYTHILAPATTFGKNVLPRAAALCDVQQISDVIEIVNANTFARPIYAGNAIATVESSDPQIFMTIRATAFDKVEVGNAEIAVEIIQGKEAVGKSDFVFQELSMSARPELTSANVVISGGRGLQSGENFKMIEELADRLNAAIGASRAAVDAGYVPNDYQVGQTGKVVAPDLYIAVGISGAIQHLAGMKDSKVIVAINKDEEAPIFQIADYYLVADLFTALPEFCAELDKIRGSAQAGNGS